MEIAEGAQNCYTFANTEETLYKVLSDILDKSHDRMEQSSKWKDRYSIDLFYKKYLELDSE